MVGKTADLRHSLTLHKESEPQKVEKVKGLAVLSAVSKYSHGKLIRRERCVR